MAESAKREADPYDMLEKAATDEKREKRDRDKLGDKLEAFLNGKEEEEEATGFMEEMRKNVVAAQQKSFEAEQKSMQLSARMCRRIRQRSGSCQDADDKMLGINAEPRHKEYEPRKRLGRRTVHSKESGLVRRRENDKDVGAVGG